MRIHTLNCGTMRPFGGALWDGVTPGLGASALTCRCLLVETDEGLVLVDTGFGMGDVFDPAGRLGPDAASLLRELEHGWLARVWAGDPASGA